MWSFKSSQRFFFVTRVLSLCFCPELGLRSHIIRFIVKTQWVVKIISGWIKLNRIFHSSSMMSKWSTKEKKEYNKKNVNFNSFHYSLCATVAKGLVTMMTRLTNSTGPICMARDTHMLTVRNSLCLIFLSTLSSRLRAGKSIKNRSNSHPQSDERGQRDRIKQQNIRKIFVSAPRTTFFGSGISLNWIFFPPFSRAEVVVGKQTCNKSRLPLAKKHTQDDEQIRRKMGRKIHARARKTEFFPTSRKNCDGGRKFIFVEDFLLWKLFFLVKFLHSGNPSAIQRVI